ncbi:ABC transporter ATP-binding protein [Devosia sp.]|uniref:ABC transporter ATP-binding protein n=1 Tax=Devosia sp. TaxID=1871048 RepID=UPI0025BA65A2|nr:ABC transporter ATP-binding protein [Devosia sp.]
MALVRLTGLTKTFARSVAVHPLDFEIEAGDFLAVLGPSGCGKSTLLRMIGGFETPTAGRINIAGRDVTGLGPENRPTNMVFQGYGLFPHMNVRQNVAYGLKLKGLNRDEVVGEVAEALRLVHLEDFAERPVVKLSGGQQQRVALARALVLRPSVLLLDEPLAALDLKLRKAMQEELRRLHRVVGGTFVFVTHDQGEALSLANRIAVMEAGRIVQVGVPEDIYRRPASRFVSTFIGEANVLSGERRDGVVTLPWGLSFPAAGPDGRVSVVVRPEHVALASDASPAGEVRDVVFLGSFVKLSVRMSEGTELSIHLPEQPGTGMPRVGDRVSLAWRQENVRCFDDRTSPRE